MKNHAAVHHIPGLSICLIFCDACAGDLMLILFCSLVIFFEHSIKLFINLISAKISTKIILKMSIFQIYGSLMRTHQKNHYSRVKDLQYPDATISPCELFVHALLGYKSSASSVACLALNFHIYKL